MTQDGNELFAQFIGSLRAPQGRLILLPRLLAVELHRDQSGEAREHADDFRVGHLGGRRISSADSRTISGGWGELADKLRS
ncbi:MAG: hypothetical protein ABI356_10380 [Steroidobacteraceae bacterium]